MISVQSIDYHSRCPYHPREEHRERFLSTLYTVSPDGAPADVLRCDVSAVPFNQPWPGYQRPKNQTEEAAFLNFSGEGAAEVEIFCTLPFERVTVRPLDVGVKAETDGKVIRLTLPHPGYYVVEPYDDHHVLHLFYNKKKTWEGAETATYRFGPGVHYPGRINLHSGESVYIDEAAYVYGTILGVDAENIRVFGGGILDGSIEERVVEHCYEGSSVGNMRYYRSKNITVEGVTLLNADNWTTAFFDCNGVRVEGVKIVGQWRYNTDGIDLCNTSNVLIKDTFIRSFDDTISVKGLYDHGVIENITVDGCVLWCDWGKTMENGIETRAEEYRHFVWKNCHCIHNCWTAMAISEGHQATMHDFLFENNTVELQVRQNPQIQENAGDVYSETKGTVADFAHIRNNRYYSYPHGGPNTDYGDIYDVSYKHIRIYTEEGMPKPKVSLVSESAEHPIRDVRFSDISVNGKRVTDLSDLATDIQNAQDISFE